MEDNNKNNPLNGKSILIVDDVADNLKVLGYLLKEQGFRIAIASDGNTAINSALSKPPDLILLDVSMPEMDGFTVCNIMKNSEVTKDIPVIFLTARSEITDITRGFEVGAVDYITKPFNQAELLARVKTHLDLKTARETIRSKNEELDHKNHELIQLNKSKDKFFSIIAHDLKNPFSTLIGFTEFLTEDIHKLSKEDLTEIASGLNYSANKLFELLNNLLEWSRIQTGNLSVNISDYHPAKMIQEDVSLLLQPAKNKGLEINVSTDDEVLIRADRNMFRSVIQNLVFNAIKFSYPGNEIVIKGRALGDSYEISVTDTGVGIEESVLGELFRIENKYSTAGTNDEPGTGLGLILCRELVEKMKGNISVVSSPGKGSTFSFTLPLAEFSAGRP